MDNSRIGVGKEKYGIKWLTQLRQKTYVIKTLFSEQQVAKPLKK